MLETRRVKPRPGWEEALAYLDRGTVLVVGAAGTGKTPLAGFLTAQLGRGLRRVAEIDADPGQTSIGPAGCLGLALTRPWRAPAAQWFVGGTSARNRPLHTVVGTARLAERARREGAELVVLDAPAVEPNGGGAADPRIWELLHHMTLATGVDQVVAIERNGELRPFLDVIKGRIAIYRVPAPEADPAAEILGDGPLEAGVDRSNGDAAPQERRAAARRRAAEARLRAHLADARPLRFARRRILDSAWIPGADPAPGAVVGLLDEEGFCLALGVVEEVAKDSVVLLTPWRDRRTVARLQLGALRVRRIEGPGDEPAVEWELL